MLDVCNQFSCDHFITFNSKKAVCIKCGESVHDNGCAKLNEKILKRNTEGIHLGIVLIIY